MNHDISVQKHNIFHSFLKHMLLMFLCVISVSKSSLFYLDFAMYRMFRVYIYIYIYIYSVGVSRSPTWTIVLAPP